MDNNSNAPVKANLMKKLIGRFVLYKELSKYYTADQIDQMLVDIATHGTIDLDRYVKKSEVDSALSPTSEMPVQNKVIYKKLMDYYTKQESDIKYQPKGNYATEQQLADKANASDVYTKSETYNKTEVNNLITTPDQEYVTVTATTQTTDVTDLLPATGSADTIYRVGNWDGTQYDDTCYSEYAWKGDAYVKLSTKNIGIDDNPTAGSDNLVKSDSVAKMLGIKHSGKVTGNDTSWATLSSAKRPFIQKGLVHKVTIKASGTITVPSGVSEGMTTFAVEVLNASNTQLWRGAEKTAPAHINGADVFIIPPLSEDGYLYFEGRWPNDIVIQIEVVEEFDAYNIVSGKTIEADNVNYVLRVPDYKYCENSSEAISVPAKNIAYSQIPLTSTSLWILCYNKSSHETTVRPWYSITSYDIIIGSVQLSNSGIVSSVTSSILNHVIVEKAKTVATKQLAAATVYYGAIDYSTYDCLCSINLISVDGGITIQTPHASDIALRVIEYDKDARYIRDTGSYAKFDSVKLGETTRYIRIAASYAERGFDQSNPISVSNYENDDFDAVFNRNDEVFELREQTKNPLVDYPNYDFFVDADVWSAPHQSGSHKCKVIPVTGGGNIVCLANSNVPTRVAFARTFDAEYVRTHLPMPIDGIGNSNTEPGKMRVYNIPQDCNYVVVNSVYGYADALPVSFIIDNVEYMQPPHSNLPVIPFIAQALLNKAAGDVISRNAHKEPAIRSAGNISIFGSDEIKPLAFIHISDTHVKNLDGKGYKCVENVRKVMDYYTNLKFLINTGDIVYDTFADSMEWYDIGLEGSDKLYLNVIGNHDAGQENAIVGYLESVGSDEQVYEKYIAPYKDNWNLGDGDTGENYYYKDFTEEKVRLIVLYDFETDFELTQDDTRLKYNRESCVVRQTQVDWLISTLESVPENYGVIVAHHINYRFDNSDNSFATPRLRNQAMEEYRYSSDPQWLEKILTAYQNKESINISWSQNGGVVTSLSAVHDFSNAEGEFICILAGHTHDDFIGHPYGFPNLVLLTVGSDNCHYTGKSCPRAYDHQSEDLINVVNVERNLKTITVVRIGSDFSVTGQKRDSITISYANN